jgi:hypothetical protein
VAFDEELLAFVEESRARTKEPHQLKLARFTADSSVRGDEGAGVRYPHEARELSLLFP